jgi:hypothetical protein
MVCGHSRRGLAFTMLGTLGKLSLFALVFSDFLIEGAHRGGLSCVWRPQTSTQPWQKETKRLRTKLR